MVFDMDGVLADSEPVYLAAANAVLSPYGKSITAEQHEAIMGHGVEDTWETLMAELDLPGPMSRYISAYDVELCRLLGRLSEPLPGVRPLVAELRRRGIPLAVASSSWPGWIDALVSAKMVAHPKPAPDLYLLAARTLGRPPEVCIAVEDTPTGIAAAKAAGMLAVQVRASSTAFPPLPDADIVLDSLLDFDLSLLAIPTGGTGNA